MFRTMGRSKKDANKKKTVSKIDLEKALLAVQNGMSMYRASKQFEIPKTTLRNRKIGKYQIDQPRGPHTILPAETEKLLVQWVLQMSSRGFPVSKGQLIQSVKMIVTEMEIANKFTNNTPGKNCQNLKMSTFYLKIYS